MLPHIPFYFLRHGETDWNRRRVMQGHTDIPLNAAGQQQARNIAAAVAALPLRTVCVSPLMRARRTAELVNLNRVPMVEIDALKECAFGIHEGQAADGPWRADWVAGGAIQGGETRRDYIARVTSAITEALAYPGPILIVAHGGTFWALEHLAGVELRMPNCTLYHFTPPVRGAHWGMTQIACPQIARPQIIRPT
jgi:broad specificity phosphatase PhoE